MKSNPPLRLIICGALGRMGSKIHELARDDSRFSVAACVVEGRVARGSSSFFILSSETRAHLKDADVIVDFTTPAASTRFAAMAAQACKPIVIGTTGFTKSQLEKISAASKRAPIFLSPNMSRGVNLLFYLAKLSARFLKDYDVSVAESHHKLKKDIPSGTALRLAQAAMEGRGDQKKIAIAAQRLGDVIGEHTLTLAGPNERLELTHRAQSRDLFARGALDAALWLAGRKPGLYDMLAMMGMR